MDDEMAPYAARNLCEDDFSNAVCQIYKITVTNTGNTNMYLDGYLALKLVNDDEMRFMRVYYDGDTYCINEECNDELDLTNIKSGIAVNTDGNFNREEDSNALFIASDGENPEDLIEVGETRDYYAMIWIHNEKEEQNDLQGVQNAFRGSVTFISSQGNEVTAVFE